MRFWRIAAGLASRGLSRSGKKTMPLRHGKYAGKVGEKLLNTP